MSVICPVCGTKTSVSPVIIFSSKAYLLDKSTADVAVYGKARISAITDYDTQATRYGVFVCEDCGKCYVAKQHKYDDVDWMPIYPIPHRVVSKEIPPPIKDEFEEANLCFAIGAYRACTSMCQRTLESLCQNKKVSGLNQLSEDGIISSSLFDRATEIRLWAGITKHKPLVESASKEDAEQLLEYLSMILDHVYVEPVRLEALRQKREKMDKKSTKTNQATIDE